MQFVEYMDYKKMQNRRIKWRERSIRRSDVITAQDADLRKAHEYAERQRAYKASGGVPRANDFCPFGWR